MLIKEALCRLDVAVAALLGTESRLRFQFTQFGHKLHTQKIIFPLIVHSTTAANDLDTSRSSGLSYQRELLAQPMCSVGVSRPSAHHFIRADAEWHWSYPAEARLRWSWGQQLHDFTRFLCVGRRG